MTIRFGMIVRADFGRGLANQTYSFWKHLKPDVTVLVDMADITSKAKYPQDLDAYPGAIQTKWKGYTAPFQNPEAYHALKECDILYTAETYYDERLREVPTILHVNPEFFRGEPAAQYWYPTEWRLDHLPPGEIVPTPIDDEDIALDIAGTSKLLHVGGHYAQADRNGSRVVHGMLRRMKHPIRVTSQDGMRLHPSTLGYTEPVGYTDDRWDLYDGCGILVYPRRYGGQSLQVNEAMARGLAVIMPDIPPNVRTWPVFTVPAKEGAKVKTPGGIIPSYQVTPRDLQNAVDAMIAAPDQLERWQTEALAWARDNAWSQWKPRIQELIYGR